MPVSSPDPSTLAAFATSLALGLLIGLERERSPSAQAGLRTFALVALLGSVCGLLAQALGSSWIVAAGMLCTALAIVGAYLARPDADGDPGTTTEVALVLCYALGVLCWLGQLELATMLGITMTLLLHFKAELAGLAHRLEPDELRSILQFAVLSLVVLPVLPDRDYGPYAAFNPYRTWLLVVLISGVGLAGYLALRLFGERAGTRVAGLLGGLVSSTATTLLYARLAGREEVAVHSAVRVTVLANLVVPLRLALIAAATAPALAWPLLAVLGCGAAAGVLAALPLLRGPAGPVHPPAAGNPVELPAALGFAALYSAILLAVAWLTDRAGPGGLYLAALISGTTDVDAVTLSGLRMHELGRQPAEAVLAAVVLALAANTLAKLAIAFAVGGAGFGRRVAGPLAASVAGCAAALWWQPG